MLTTDFLQTPLPNADRDQTGSTVALVAQTVAIPRENPRFYKTRSITPNLFLLFDEKA